MDKDKRNRELIEKIINGDNDAFLELYKSYFFLPYAFRKRFYNEEDFKDKKQEFWVKLFKVLRDKEFDPKDKRANFSTWLYQFALNSLWPSSSPKLLQPVKSSPNSKIVAKIWENTLSCIKILLEKLSEEEKFFLSSYPFKKPMSLIINIIFESKLLEHNEKIEVKDLVQKIKMSEENCRQRAHRIGEHYRKQIAECLKNKKNEEHLQWIMDREFIRFFD